MKPRLPGISPGLYLGIPDPGFPLLSKQGMKILEGEQNARDRRFAVVVSKFNEFVTDRLLAEALDVLRKSGANEDDIEVARVPGAFEIPLVAKRLACSGRFHAVICLGAVIRGETPHFEFICAQASRGIAQAALESGVPVIFGVLTTETTEQAIERAGTRFNRGAEAARAAIEMATLLEKLTGGKQTWSRPTRGKLARPKRTRRT